LIIKYYNTVITKQEAETEMWVTFAYTA